MKIAGSLSTFQRLQSLRLKIRRNNVKSNPDLSELAMPQDVEDQLGADGDEMQENDGDAEMRY